MGRLEEPRTSFVVRIWIEEPSEDGFPPIWRGSITHVPGGECRYLQDLQVIPDFITPYLRSMGVGGSVLERLRQWVRRLATFRQ